MLYSLVSLVTRALADVRLVDTVKVDSEAYLARSNLRDDGANRSRQVPMHH